MVDFEKKFKKKLKEKKAVAIILIAFGAIIGIATLWRSWDYIYYKFVAKPGLRDLQLKDQTFELCRDLAQFVTDRRKNEPEIDFNDWEGSTQRSIEYSQESINLYYERFAPDVAILREEFLTRGMWNDEIERFYKHPTNYLGLQELTLKLAELAAKL